MTYRNEDTGAEITDRTLYQKTVNPDYTVVEKSVADETIQRAVLASDGGEETWVRV